MLVVNHFPFGVVAHDGCAAQPLENAHLDFLRTDRHEPVEPGGSAPAERFRFRDGCGEVGLISSVTQPFCGTCDRLRLTADGALRNCLFSDREISVREMLRRGAGDDELALAFREAVWSKLPGHGINEPGFLQPARSMSMIGG